MHGTNVKKRKNEIIVLIFIVLFIIHIFIEDFTR